jgi:hypothetical protein
MWRDASYAVGHLGPDFTQYRTLPRHWSNTFPHRHGSLSINRFKIYRSDIVKLPSLYNFLVEACAEKHPHAKFGVPSYHGWSDMAHWCFPRCPPGGHIEYRTALKIDWAPPPHTAICHWNMKSIGQSVLEFLFYFIEIFIHTGGCCVRDIIPIHQFTYHQFTYFTRRRKYNIHTIM